MHLIRDTDADLVALQEIQYRSWLDDPRHQAVQIHAGEAGERPNADGVYLSDHLGLVADLEPL